MREIERSTSFKRDFKREMKGRHRATLDADLLKVLTTLTMDDPLEGRHRDHDLGGSWIGYRDCHIRPDLVLIYRKHENVLQLARLGSHSEVFG